MQSQESGEIQLGKSKYNVSFALNAKGDVIAAYVSPLLEESTDPEEIGTQTRVYPTLEFKPSANKVLLEPVQQFNSHIAKMSIPTLTRHVNELMAEKKLKVFEG